MQREPVSAACFGEVLWDILPEGKILGGAPLNACYHLIKSGLSSTIITSIGNDPSGKEIREIMLQRGICTDLVQETLQYPTGYVLAEPGPGGETTYRFGEDLAWDHIAVTAENRLAVSQADYFIFGTLAARSAESRRSLFALLELAPTPVLDINLRPPHVDYNLLPRLLQHASILKLNESELELLASLFACSGNTKHQVAQLAASFGISEIILTCGAKGALVWKDGNTWSHPGFRVTVADTIGSGDAFLAAYLAGRATGESMESRLERANRLAAFVTTKQGACPAY